MFEKAQNKRLNRRLEKLTSALAESKAEIEEKNAEIAALKNQLLAIEKSAGELETEIESVKKVREDYFSLVQDLKIILRELKKNIAR